MAKRTEYLHGTAKHRRTEGDYMGVLLDTITLDDWRDVVVGALNEAKGGNPAARAWLAQYLVGKPETKAPTPLNVVVQQLNGSDPLVERLAKPVINRALYPSLHANDDWEAKVHSAIAEEMTQKLANVEPAGNPDAVRDCVGYLGQQMKFAK
jgi:hypothetical protein